MIITSQDLKQQNLDLLLKNEEQAGHMRPFESLKSTLLKTHTQLASRMRVIERFQMEGDIPLLNESQKQKLDTSIRECEAKIAHFSELKQRLDVRAVDLDAITKANMDHKIALIRMTKKKTQVVMLAYNDVDAEKLNLTTDQQAEWNEVHNQYVALRQRNPLIVWMSSFIWTNPIDEKINRVNAFLNAAITQQLTNCRDIHAECHRQQVQIVAQQHTVTSWITEGNRVVTSARENIAEVTQWADRNKWKKLHAVLEKLISELQRYIYHYNSYSGQFSRALKWLIRDTKLSHEKYFHALQLQNQFAGLLTDFSIEKMQTHRAAILNQLTVAQNTNREQEDKHKKTRYTGLFQSRLGKIINEATVAVTLCPPANN
jgi:putative sterol carrier protein